MKKMADNLRIDAFFTEVEEAMSLKFRGWEKDLPHQGEKGGIRERRLVDFLTSILPKKYGLGTGHIVSYEEPFISYQTDIVIYDRQNGISLPVDDYYSLFPCECVYAAIEVKSKLKGHDGKNKEDTSIYQCLKNTNRLKELKRDELPPIHSIVFAYETDWKGEQAKRTIHWFNNLGAKYSLSLPEEVFVLDPGFVLTKGPSIRGYSQRNQLVREYPNSSLLYFVSNLLRRLSDIDKIGLKIPRLWLDYKNWLPKELIARHYKYEEQEN